MDENEVNKCATKSFIERANDFVYLYKSENDMVPMKVKFNGKMNQLSKLEIIDNSNDDITYDDYDMNQIVEFNDIRAYVSEKSVKLTVVNLNEIGTVLVNYADNNTEKPDISS